MSPSFTIRRATSSDAAALGQLGGHLLRTHYAFDQKRFMAPGNDPESGYGHFLASQLSNNDSILLVAEQEGRVVGYIWAGLEPRSWKELREACGFIDDVVVEAGQRRSGIASALVEAAAAWLKERGAPRVLLWSAEPNEAAQRLFERLGFRRTMVEMTREL